MRVAIYGRAIELADFKSFFTGFTESLRTRNVEFCVLESYANYLQDVYEIKCDTCSENDVQSDSFDCLLSLGGDGTMLDTLAIVRDSGIPVMGINLGRLGFLASIQMEDFEAAIDALLNGEYEVDRRAVLELNSDIPKLNDFPYALNDIVVQKRDTSAMITVKTWLNKDFLNTYWADGLIVASPTGSSGYSLSCGGPFLFPGSNSMVLTPIAAHNLTVRPIVLPDQHHLRFEVGSRNDTVLISLDSRSYQIPGQTMFEVSRADFTFNMVQLNGTSHMDTIRNKLMWGADHRNR